VIGNGILLRSWWDANAIAKKYQFQVPFNSYQKW